METKDYINFLLEKEFYPKQVYISKDYLLSEVATKFCMPIKVNSKIIEVNKVSVLFEFNVGNITFEKRIYCHLSTSPEKFYDKIANAITKHIYNKLTDEEKENFLKNIEGKFE